MLRMPMIMPYDEKSNHFEDTLISPAHEIDWVRRLPIQAIVNNGRLSPDANISVNRVAPPRPIRKLIRPPQKSPSPVKKIFPSAYASTPKDAMDPMRMMASVWLIPCLTSSSTKRGVATDRSARQKYSAP